jgi:hypothetical protein
MSVWGIRLDDEKFDPFSTGGGGFMALPGNYTVSMSMVFNGEEKELAGPVEFTAKVLNNTTLPAADRAELVAFQDQIGELVDAVNAAEEFAGDLMKRTQYIRQAVQNTPGAPHELMVKAAGIEKQLQDLRWKMEGQIPAASEEENIPAPPSINYRLGEIISATWGNSSTPTQTQRDQYALLEELKQIAEVDLKALEAELDKLDAPWTPGRIPEWTK